MNKVCFRKNGEFGEIAVIEGEKLERFYRLKDGFLTGSVFVGKVRKVTKNLGAFVDIGQEKDGLLAGEHGLKSGDLVTVTVTKEPTEEKGCALSENISLPGKFAVINASGKMSFSRKISEKKREEILNAVKPSGKIGFVFRSLCEQTDIDKIAEECGRKEEEYREIIKKAAGITKITKLWQDDARKVAERLSEDGVLTEDFKGIEEEIKKLGQRKITAGGAEIVFDKTEALTAVDVNFHRFAREYKDGETAVFEANRVAIKEIARQIRLRNIGGIIMIDFISMKNKDNIQNLKNILDEELSKDSVMAKSELVESVGMFAVVRKKRFDEI